MLLLEVSTPQRPELDPMPEVYFILQSGTSGRAAWPWDYLVLLEIQIRKRSSVRTHLFNAFVYLNTKAPDQAELIARGTVKKLDHCTRQFHYREIFNFICLCPPLTVVLCYKIESQKVISSK